MRIAKAHLLAFAILLLLFAGLNVVIVTANQGFQRALLTVSVTLFGPMTGAISRGFQDCCLDFSLRLLLFFAPALLVGILSQLAFNRRPAGKVGSSIRLVLWTAGWLLWFFSGIISFGHALS